MSQRRLRIPLGGRPSTGLVDFVTDESPAVWDGDDLELEFWLGSERVSDDPLDITEIDTVTMEVRATETSVDLIMPQQSISAIDLDECLLRDWRLDDGKHGTFTVEGEWMNFANGTRRIWVSFQVLFLDDTIRTMGAGYMDVAQSGHGSSAGGSKFLQIASATPDANGFYSVSFRGFTGKITILNVTENPSGNPNSGHLYVTSATPDATTGLYPVTFRDKSGWLSILAVAAAPTAPADGYVRTASSSQNAAGNYSITFRSKSGSLLINNVA